MAFGDNSAARAARARLIEEQANTQVSVQASSGALYRVYKDLPPGIGWVVRRVGVICPKWYLKDKETALSLIDLHDKRFGSEKVA